MARYNDQQSKQIQQERKEQILKAALSIFAEHGIEGAKMSMIAEAVGISKGLLYHYFESKEEVLNASLSWALNGAEELLDEVKKSSETPIVQITHFTKSALSQGNQDVFRIIQRSLNYQGLDNKTKVIIGESSHYYSKMLLPIFVEGQERGEVIEEDPLKLVNLYLTIVSGILMEDVKWTHEELDWNTAMLLRIIKK